MSLKKAAAKIVDALTKPGLSELAERLRTARVELAEARKVTPNEPGAYYTGLPDNLIEAAIDCCEKAIKVRDADLAFRQGDSESNEIYASLAEKLRAKSGKAYELQAAVKAAQDALDSYRSEIDADVAETDALIRALNIRRRAEDLPPARNLRDREHKFECMLGDLQLTEAAEWLSRPVPGRNPAEGDPIQSRINEIKRLDTERQKKRALQAKPWWEDSDDWFAKWMSKDKAGRAEMEARGHELKRQSEERR